MQEGTPNKANPPAKILTQDDTVKILTKHEADKLTGEHITIPYGYTIIDAFAFNERKDVVSITIPSSVISIGRFAFYSCENLVSVTIPDSVTSISGYAFSFCKKLTNIILPPKIMSICERTFRCSNLENIDIPNGVTSIDKRAFDGCLNLANITIPDSVTNIEHTAFEDCRFNLIVSCSKNSFAYDYCLKNNLKIKTIDTSKLNSTNNVNNNLRFNERDSAKNIKSEHEEPIKKASAFIDEAFADIIGMDSVKEQMKKLYDFVRIEKIKSKRGLPTDSNRSYNFILYGNPGTGKTTVARIIGKMLYTLGIRQNNIFRECARVDLVSQYVGETAIKTKDVIHSAMGGVLFIDEAYTLRNRYGQEAIDTLNKDMEDNRSKYTVIMAGYKAKMTELFNYSNPGFRSRFTYNIEIPDYSDDELIQIAHSIANRKNYTIEPSGNGALRKRIVKERIDETFGNARFMRDVIERAEENMATRLAGIEIGQIKDEDLTLIRAEDICPPKSNETSLDEVREKLNKMIGLTEVKNYVNTLENQIIVRKEQERRGKSSKDSKQSLHMVFKGNPGTGKTTVAELIGSLLGELGILKRGNVFVERTRADLVGKYAGHTATKVTDVIRSAMGGVLFIDEAYSLKNEEHDSFGQEAIDTLVVEMEKHRDSLVVILAGYSSNMDKFLQSNQGLYSRIAHHLLFEDYSVDDMTEIFKSFVEQNNCIMADNLYPKVKSILEERSKQENFGNARGVRNLFEKIIRTRNNRIAKRHEAVEKLHDDELVEILEEDLR